MSQIAVWRGWKHGMVGYWHHGVLLPDGTVIHYRVHSGSEALPDKGRARIVRTSYRTFQGHSRDVYDVIYPRRDCHSPDEIVRRAKSRMGERRYHLIFDNCESFAKWCVTGEEQSRQVSEVLSGVKRGVERNGLGGGVRSVLESAYALSWGDCLDGRMVRRAPPPIIESGKMKRGDNDSGRRSPKAVGYADGSGYEAGIGGKAANKVVVKSGKGSKVRAVKAVGYADEWEERGGMYGKAANGGRLRYPKGGYEVPKRGYVVQGKAKKVAGGSGASSGSSSSSGGGRGRVPRLEYR